MYKAKVLLKFIFFQNLAAHIVYGILADLVLGVVGRKLVGDSLQLHKMLKYDESDGLILTIVTGVVTFIVAIIILMLIAGLVDKVHKQWRKVKKNS